MITYVHNIPAAEIRVRVKGILENPASKNPEELDILDSFESPRLPLFSELNGSESPPPLQTESGTNSMEYETTLVRLGITVAFRAYADMHS